jgi:hypothetical protein
LHTKPTTNVVQPTTNLFNIEFIDDIHIKFVYKWTHFRQQSWPAEKSSYSSKIFKYSSKIFIFFKFILKIFIFFLLILNNIFLKNLQIFSKISLFSKNLLILQQFFQNLHIFLKYLLILQNSCEIFHIIPKSPNSLIIPIFFNCLLKNLGFY